MNKLTPPPNRKPGLSDIASGIAVLKRSLGIHTEASDVRAEEIEAIARFYGLDIDLNISNAIPPGYDTTRASGIVGAR